MARFVNYYEVLGVEPDADRKSIKSAFRRMAEQYHPDKVSGLGDKLRELADEQMRQINDARRVLLDPPRSSWLLGGPGTLGALSSLGCPWVPLGLPGFP